MGILFIVLFMSACSQNVRQAQQGHSSAQSPAHHRLPESSQRYPASQPVTPRGQQLRINQARNRMVRLATQTLGAPYRYGGTNPQRGFDCSGLMRYVHQQAGINIPRTAAEQRIHSRTLSYAQLKPGDMLFFKTGKRSEHVGIYIGNRQFIHASTGSRRVRIAKMDSAYWYKHFIKFGTYL